MDRSALEGCKRNFRARRKNPKQPGREKSLEGALSNLRNPNGSRPEFIGSLPPMDYKAWTRWIKDGAWNIPPLNRRNLLNRNASGIICKEETEDRS